MTVDLPGKLAEDFAALAAARGRSPEEYLRELVEREVQSNRTGESMAELIARSRAEIAAAGIPMLNDEVLEAEFREMRRGYGEE
jgi:hypothetical protein